VNLTTDLNTAAVIAAFAAPLVLIVVYTIAAPWYRTAVGRALVQVKASISLAMFPALAHRIAGHGLGTASPFFAWLQTVTWAFLAAMVLRLTWLSWRINRNERRGAGGGADLTRIRCLAEKTQRIAADTHKALTGFDHPDAPAAERMPEGGSE
jgi:hypothetical protein